MKAAMFIICNSPAASTNVTGHGNIKSTPGNFAEYQLCFWTLKKRSVWKFPIDNKFSVLTRDQIISPVAFDSPTIK